MVLSVHVRASADMACPSADTRTPARTHVFGSVPSCTDAGHEAAQHLAPPDLTLASAVTNRLVTLQSDMASHNSSTWADSDTYAAWVQRYGTPQEAAEWVRSAPAERLAAGLLRTMQVCDKHMCERICRLA